MIKMIQEANTVYDRIIPLVKCLQELNSLQLMEYGIRRNGHIVESTSFGLEKASTDVARLLYNDYYLKFGTLLGGTATISVACYTDQVMISGDVSTGGLTTNDVIVGDITEETLFQYSLLYPPDVLQRLVTYSTLYKAGYSFFLNWHSSSFSEFELRVTNAGRRYGIIHSTNRTIQIHPTR